MIDGKDISYGLWSGSLLPPWITFLRRRVELSPMSGQGAPDHRFHPTSERAANPSAHGLGTGTIWPRRGARRGLHARREPWHATDPCSAEGAEAGGAGSIDVEAYVTACIVYYLYACKAYIYISMQFLLDLHFRKQMHQGVIFSFWCSGNSWHVTAALVLAVPTKNLMLYWDCKLKFTQNQSNSLWRSYVPYYKEDLLYHTTRYEKILIYV